MSKIWFTSDNHFGHQNILKFCPKTRNCSSIEEHDRLQIKKFQELVSPDDTVYFLGDMFFCSHDRAESIIQQIPGQKHLIYGNHDQLIKKSHKLRQYFVSISDYKEIVIDKVPVALFHFPMMEWNKMHYGAYALFGHVHGSLDENPMVVSARTMDVGVDSRPNGLMPLHGQFAPWSWEQIKSILIQRPIRPHH